MFLITTADQHFWKTDEKILFLGEWCKLYNQSNVWASLDYEILPYHWDDRKKLYQDYLYLQTVYDKYLKLLAEKLNHIHNVNYSLRYWRIILGPWLDWFIQILYDRFLSVCNAAESKKVTTTWIASVSPQWIPNDFAKFIEYFVSDEYNHYLYSRLIEELGCIPFEITEIKAKETDHTAPTINSNKYNLKVILQKLVKLYSRYVPDRWNKVVFVSSYLPPRELVKLQLSMRQLPYLSTSEVLPCEVPVNNLLREKLVLGEGTNQFESILDKFVATQIPTAYVEGYADMVPNSLKVNASSPKMIFTETAHHGNEGFKFWAAHQVENGARLIIGQHGGHYGIGLFSNYERRDIAISDRYYSWGWQTENESKVVPLPAVPLIQFQQKHLKSKLDGFILWIAMSMPRYAYGLYAAPIGPQYLEYFDQQRRFLQAVSPSVHNLLMLRLYPQEYGWSEANRWQDIDPTLRVYRGPRRILEQLKESRLAISTYNATTYLQTFSTNSPSILFWNPAHWEVRPEAKPYFDELRQAEILHDTPEAAAAKVNEIYDDPLSWWGSQMVQAVRQRFIDRYALRRKDWVASWSKALQQEIPKNI